MTFVGIKGPNEKAIKMTQLITTEKATSWNLVVFSQIFMPFDCNLQVERTNSEGDYHPGDSFVV